MKNFQVCFKIILLITEGVMSSFYLTAKDGKEIFINKWDNVKSPKGVVQILHGMVEYSGRYDDFAKFLNTNGYLVFASDHRGHGKTDENSLGCVGKDNFDLTLSDCIELSKQIKKDYPNLPLMVLGHSYGSFLLQRYLQETDDLASCAILVGSAYQKGSLLNSVGRCVTGLLCLFAEKKPSKFMANMAFGPYDKPFKRENLKNAWLTKDKGVVEKYNNDKFCTFYVSAGFMNSMLKAFKAMHKTQNLAKIKKDMPILIASGDKDPVGSFSKTVKKLYDSYLDTGLTDVTLKLYKDGRHEILNETNKKEVYADFLKFFDSHING